MTKFKEVSQLDENKEFLTPENESESTNTDTTSETTENTEEFAENNEDTLQNIDGMSEEAVATETTPAPKKKK